MRLSITLPLDRPLGTMPLDVPSRITRQDQKSSPPFARARRAVVRFSIVLAVFVLSACSVIAQESPTPTAIETGPDDTSTEQTTAEEELDLEEIMAKPEVKQMLAEFDSTKAELVEAMGNLRATQIRFSNQIDRSEAAVERYAKRRDRVRSLLRKMLQLANQKMLLGDPEAGNFAMTMVQNHFGNSIYDVDTYEASTKLLDSNMSSRFLFQAALRSSVSVGQFDTARALAEIMKDDEELAVCDYGIMGSMDELEEMHRFEKVRREADAEANLPRIRFHTTNGDFVVELYLNDAPSAVSNFIKLVDEGFYQDAEFFQVVDDLLALCGHTTNTTASRFLLDETNPETARKGWTGTLMMANLPFTEGKFIPNSSTTQFSILLLPLPVTSAQQTVFGRVIEGMDVVSTFRRVDPNKKKDKKKIVLPPDRIISTEIIRAPDQLPDPIYVDRPGPQMPSSPVSADETPK